MGTATNTAYAPFFLLRQPSLIKSIVKPPCIENRHKNSGRVCRPLGAYTDTLQRDHGTIMRIYLRLWGRLLSNSTRSIHVTTIRSPSHFTALQSGFSVTGDGQRTSQEILSTWLLNGVSFVLKESSHDSLPTAHSYITTTYILVHGGLLYEVSHVNGLPGWISLSYWIIIPGHRWLHNIL